jgi:hypothetical protein
MSIFRRVVAGIEVDGIREIRFVRLGPILAQNWPWSRVRPLQLRRSQISSLPSQALYEISLCSKISICIDEHSLQCPFQNGLSQYIRNGLCVSTHSREIGISNGPGLHSIPYSLEAELETQSRVSLYKPHVIQSMPSLFETVTQKFDCEKIPLQTDSPAL